MCRNAAVPTPLPTRNPYVNPTPPPSNDARNGAIAAIAAYVVWGLTPVYFKAIGQIGAGEIIAHRVLWSALLLVAVVLATRSLGSLLALRANPRVLWGLAASALLVTSNWLVYVWAVNDGRVLAASLGYFINPLVSAALGAVFLGERLSRLQRVAFGLAALGVVNQVIQIAALPWIPLFLATSFGLYGLLRKRLAVDPVHGLLVETLFAVPLAMAYLAWLAADGRLGFAHHGLATDLLLVAAGVVTSVPLILFVHGARRLRLATMGFLQYLAPTLMFALGVLAYGEAFDRGRLATFVLIWLGLAIYSWDLLRRSGPSRTPA